MPIHVDLESVSIGSSGEVIITDADLQKQISQQVPVGVKPMGTNSGSCNGNNVACTNMDDCSGSTNSSRCTNNGHCIAPGAPG